MESHDLSSLKSIKRRSPRLSRDERRRQTREELLEVAAGVFRELGYHRASVDLVAEAAGYTKGAVYSNFSGKDDLFLAVFDRETERRLRAVTQAVGAQRDQRSRATAGTRE